MMYSIHYKIAPCSLVQADLLYVGSTNAIQDLQYAAQGVAVRYNHHVAARHQVRLDVRLPQRSGARDGVFQGLGEGNEGGVQGGVLALVAVPVRVVCVAVQ